MLYIHARQLINEAMENDLLMGSANHVIVYREAGEKEKAGWYLETKENLAKKLMTDPLGQKALIKALADKGVHFVPRKYPWLNQDERKTEVNKNEQN